MTARQLPARPSLEQLKRQAKELLHAAQSGDSSALARLRALPAFATATDTALARAPLALHDAQSVIAREHGFDSWNTLRERVEELTLEFDAAVTQFIEAATDGRSDRAARLLALHPAIATANFHTALLLGDASTVEQRLAADPSLATKPGGPRDWEPLHYICHNSVRHDTNATRDGAVAIARALIERGADPNTRFPWEHHGVHRPVLWGAVCNTRSLPLAAALLELGADPNDGVTLPIAASGGNLDALELLHAHGADANQPWATDGSATLYAILHWAAGPAGPVWLLDHGANADPVFPATGETPLHVVAARWDARLAELLANHGADITRRRADGRTPYAVAELSGNRDVAAWLLAHGAHDDMSNADRLVAACSRGDGTAARAMLAANPALRAELGAAYNTAYNDALIKAAERGDTQVLETMLSCGFDPNIGDDEIGKTPLHAAAMEGWPDAVRVLLAHGASPAARDKEFHGTPLVWAAEGCRSRKDDGRDHAAVGRLLLDAGSPADWQSGEEPAQTVLDILAEWQRSALTDMPEMAG
ncbi:MAG: ankyrin repeat domain-containing protein [Gemmatimonadaceae bacterium]